MLHRQATKVSLQQTLKPSSRIKQPGLRLKSGSLDIVPSEEKAQAMAASDWRRTAPTASCTERNNKKRIESGLRRSESSDENMSQLISELENMELEPTPTVKFYRPKEIRAPWETNRSAPGWRASGSESSNGSRSLNRCALSLPEVTMVQLKRAEPMAVNLHGEKITLPNKFTFDVTPVDIHDGSRTSSEASESSSWSFAELKRLNPRSRIRRLTSEDSYDVLEDIQEILSHNHEGGTISSSQTQETQSKLTKRPEDRSSAESALSGYSVIDHEPDRQQGAPEEKPKDERFQSLLSRLHLDNRNAKDESAALKRRGSKITHARNFDPAIIEAKVKKPSPKQAVDEDKFFGRNPNLSFPEQEAKSRDSGYSTLHPKRDGVVERSKVAVVEWPAPSEKPQERSSTSTTCSKLNPAAPEFKSVNKEKAVPIISPKRRTRAPITDIFPDVMKEQKVASSEPAIHGPLHAGRGLADPLQVRGHPPSHPATSMPVPVPSIPNATTFQAPTLYGPTIAPNNPTLFGADGKVNRPIFPVTQKPRDNDPIKQQAYESYLEWRKANEPGYHLKCKMRQANRILRQNYPPDSIPNEWKVMAEKAKALVASNQEKAKAAIAESVKAAVKAAAAAASIEKKTKAEVVKDEWKAKVQMASGMVREMPQSTRNLQTDEKKAEDQENDVQPNQADTKVEVPTTGDDRNE
ncbi:hypothetical protein QBC35DRAFT_375975 [Podospora australis]|uniref:Uncharacterized protein n=1 Tax=Podospora australis TaxID=1536484 RepID=A0AAN6X0T4_9PEZI|nr:hypothetical protein QBC35DRAFT_375975 [Podospora australis]